ncbi:hypothetical protein MOTT27_02499 [Mycobacterium intracellulare subsp. yongonense]|nr:hypothetical protein MOTT27_02499 [Mycobacterium intracellulare subsp. yongonense]
MPGGERGLIGHWKLLGRRATTDRGRGRTALSLCLHPAPGA